MPTSSPPGDEHDPNFGVRELGELWSWGLETSRVMGERVLGMYRDLGVSALGFAGGDVESELRRVRLDAERLADLSVGVFDRMIAVARRLSEENGRSGGATQRIVMKVAAGQRGCSEVWVHNVSGDDHPPPRLSCTQLVTADGAHIPPSNVHIDLALDPIAARSSRCFDLTVDVPESARGTYHGLLLSSADTESTIAVRIEVVDPAASATTTPGEL